MKLCLLLCLSFVPWGQSYSAAPEKQPNAPIQPQPQLQDSTQPNCDHMQRLSAYHEQQRYQTPRGDKFVDFDWHLSKELNAIENGNIVISPISLKVVLAMLFEGARGQTANEIGNALDLHNATSQLRFSSRERFSNILHSLQTSQGEHKIKMGTHAFIDQTAEPKIDYQCKLKTYYNSDIVKVDFSNPSAAVKVINNWANNVTEGHIQDLISEAEAQSSTIMLLLNAVYFKGQWEIPFPANQTKDGTFYLDDKRTVTVPLMNVTDRFGYYDLSQIEAQLIQLPYKGNKFSMYVLLPNNKTGLDAITRKLGPERSLMGIIDHMIPMNVNLIMPKFEFDFTVKLRPTLEKLGIKTMFSAEAELNDIAKTQNGLAVSNVLQKAGISVAEAGTVAYAATAAELVDKFGGSMETIEFKVDRPFLFFIEDTTSKTTVFVGKVTNPDKVKVVSAPQETLTGQPSGEVEPGNNEPNLVNRIDESEPNDQDSRPKDTTTQSRFNYFDADLLQKVSKSEKGNFVISPASVKTLLGLIMEAAGGLTRQEVQGLLRLPSDTTQARQLMGKLHDVLQKMNTKQVTVDSATNAFISKDLTFNTSYTKFISDLYKAGVDGIDFKNPENAANRINSWVSAQTRGNIPTLVGADTIDPETVTILVNTVYFKANWKEEFLLRDTHEQCFYSEPKLDCHPVPIMSKQEEMFYKFDKDFNSHIVQVPYKDKRFSMVLVVPARRDGIRQLAQDINRLTFPGLLEKSKPTDVYLRLPQFSVEHEAELKHTLTQMGLNTVFTDEADLPFMINNKQGKVSAVIHKAKIDVNEKGTEAAAASGVIVVPLMSGNDAVNVTANHPFFYFIYEVESKSVLFAGRISSLGEGSQKEENTVDEQVTPLSASKPQNPNKAQPASYGSESYNGFTSSYEHGSSNGLGSTHQPQSYPSTSTGFPTRNKVEFLGIGNQPYNKGPLPQSSFTPNGPGAIEYPPTDQDEVINPHVRKHNNSRHERRNNHNN